jgi:hypothetical protein
MLITGQLMTLTLPGGESLRLGRDLDHPFPQCLRELTDSALLAFLRNIDPTPDSLSASGALDWADLRDRMHFIADFFRCYQEDTRLFSQPDEGSPG